MVIFRARSTSDPNYYYTIESNVEPLASNTDLGPIHYTNADKDCYNSCVSQFSYNGNSLTVGYWVFASAPSMHKKFYGPGGIIEDVVINNVSGNNLHSGTISSYSSIEPWVANFASTDRLTIELSLVPQASSLAEYMEIILAPTPPQYQWSSVPAISGKNGILLPMSTLNDINDGNEVTTSDTSKFNPNDSSNIKNLVDAVVNDF